MQLTDPTLPPMPTQGLGLTPAEQAAIGMQVDPSATLGEFRERDNIEQSWLERAEFDRLKQENEAMKSQLGQTSAELQQVRSGYDQLSGQVNSWQAQQAQQAQAAQTLAQFELTQEERENFGEMMPVVEKAIGKTAAQMQTEFDQRLARERAQWQQEATAPLQQQLAETQQQIEAQRIQNEQRFQSDLMRGVQALGFADINAVTHLPEFQARYQQATAPGITQAWGDTLSNHIKSQNAEAALAMLKDFRDNHTNFAPDQELAEVPSGSAPVRPQTREGNEALARREQLLAIYQKRMEDANQGIFPPGMDRIKYRKAQQELRAQIDLIPTN